MKYFSKSERILQICKGKSVLHLGAIGFTDLNNKDRILNFNKTLHSKLSKVANVKGVDYSLKVIKILSEQGINNIFFGNVEKLEEVELNQKFEVVVIGDLIEHLANPGLMLKGLHRFCDESTIIIITTPNSFGILNFVRYFFNKFYEGEEHVLCFNTKNLDNLLKRYNFSVISIDSCYQDHATSYGIRFLILRYFFRFIPKLGGTLFFRLKLNES